MSRNRVRGPSSALSSFLRERGIVAPRNVFARVDPAAEPDAEAPGGEEPVVETAPVDQENTQVELVEEPSSSVPAAVVAKKKAVKRKPDSDLDNDTGKPGRSKHTKLNPKDKIKPQDLSMVRLCGSCQRRYQSNSSEDTVCAACRIIGNAPSKGGQAAKRAAKKREMAAFELTGESNVCVLPLRDVCIKLIAQYINQVEELGDMPVDTLIKLSKIICKQRKLDNTTVQLFIGPQHDKVHLYDCTSNLI